MKTEKGRMNRTRETRQPEGRKENKRDKHQHYHHEPTHTTHNKPHHHHQPNHTHTGPTTSNNLPEPVPKHKLQRTTQNDHDTTTLNPPTNNLPIQLNPPAPPTPPSATNRPSNSTPPTTEPTPTTEIPSDNKHQNYYDTDPRAKRHRAADQPAPDPQFNQQLTHIPSSTRPATPSAT
jgi:hypothetical protein